MNFEPRDNISITRALFIGGTGRSIPRLPQHLKNRTYLHDNQDHSPRRLHAH